MAKKDRKSWLICTNFQLSEEITAKLVEVITVINKYEDCELFLTNFLLGDWRDQPLEIRQLVRKLDLIKLRNKQ